MNMSHETSIINPEVDESNAITSLAFGECIRKNINGTFLSLSQVSYRDISANSDENFTFESIHFNPFSSPLIWKR